MGVFGLMPVRAPILRLIGGLIALLGLLDLVSGGPEPLQRHIVPLPFLAIPLQLGLLLFGGAIALDRSPRSRGLGTLGLAACLLAIASFHSAAIVSGRSALSHCGCLRNLGSPSHLLVLAGASVGLLAIASLSQGSIASRRRASVAPALALVLSVLGGALGFALMPDASVYVVRRDSAEPPANERLPILVGSSRARTADGARVAPQTGAQGGAAWVLHVSLEHLGPGQLGGSIAVYDADQILLYESTAQAEFVLDSNSLKSEGHPGELVGLPASVAWTEAGHVSLASAVVGRPPDLRVGMVRDVGEQLQGRVTTHAGRGVEGVRLLVAGADDRNGLASSAARHARVLRDGLPVSEVVSGPDGAFTVAGWRAPAAAVHVLSRDWHLVQWWDSASGVRVLRSRMVDARAPVRVEIGRVLTACARIGFEGETDASDPWTLVQVDVRLDGLAPKGLQVPSVPEANRGTSPSDVRTFLSWICIDDPPSFDSQAGLVVTAKAPGYETAVERWFWADLDSGTPRTIRMRQHLGGSRSSVRVKLAEAPRTLVGAMAMLAVRDASAPQSETIAFGVMVEEDVTIRMPRPLAPGRYVLSGEILAGDCEFEVAGTGSEASVSAPCASLAGVQITATNHAARLEERFFVRVQRTRSAADNMPVTQDSYAGLRPVARRDDPHGMCLWFPTRTPVYVRLGTSEGRSAEVEATADLDKVAAFEVELVTPQR